MAQHDNNPEDNDRFREIIWGEIETGRYTKWRISTVQARFGGGEQINELFSIRKWRWAKALNKWLPIKKSGACFEMKFFDQFKKAIDKIEESKNKHGNDIND